MSQMTDLCCSDLLRKKIVVSQGISVVVWYPQLQEFRRPTGSTRARVNCGQASVTSVTICVIGVSTQFMPSIPIVTRSIIPSVPSCTSVPSSLSEDGPEIPADVHRKSPSAVAEASRDVEPDEVEENQRAQANRGMPTVSLRHEQLKSLPRFAREDAPIQPRRVRKRRQRYRSGSTAISAEWDRHERNWKLHLEPLASARTAR